MIQNYSPPIILISQTYHAYMPNHFIYYAMMIICSLVKMITIHNHIHKKNHIANINNYCFVLTQYIHYIPNEHTSMDYNDVYAIYH